MATIRILLVDDNALFRDGLQTILSGQPNMAVVGEANNGQEALHLASTLLPDVILMDVQMPLLDGITATRQMQAICPQCRVIVLTTFHTLQLEQDALDAGAFCVLDKDISAVALAAAIQASM